VGKVKINKASREEIARQIKEEIEARTITIA
jgi:hypothetical protein